MGSIYKKELRSYFYGMTGAIFIGFVLLIEGIYISAYVFTDKLNQFQSPLSAMLFVYLPAIPVLTMRSIAEEKGNRTDNFLYTLPIKLSKIVIAKYLAMVTVLAVPTVLLAFVPLIMTMYGAVDLLVAYSSLFIVFLLGCALIAVGMFISSLTESQVISAVISIAVFIALYVMTGIAQTIPDSSRVSMILFGSLAIAAALVIYTLTKNTVVSLIIGAVLVAADVGLYIWNSAIFGGAFASFLGALDVFGRTTTFYSGIFDIGAVVYYLSIIVLFVFFTVQSMEKKRWSEVD